MNETPLKPCQPVRLVIVGYGPLGEALLKGALTCQSDSLCPIELIGVFPWVGHGYPSGSSVRMGDIWQAQGHLDELCMRARLTKVPMVTFPSVNSFEFTRFLIEHQVNVVLVGSWGERFKPHLLNLSQVLFINCHPSLLPLHRGPNPYSAVIQHQRSETGVTFHHMDAGFDTGPILYQQALSLYGTETGGMVRRRCAYLAEHAVIDLLIQLARGGLVPVPQPQGGSYDKAPDDASGWVDWQQDPETVMRTIRALKPWVDSYGVLPVTWRPEGVKVGFDSAMIHPLQVISEAIPQPQVPKPGSVLYQTAQEVWVTSVDPDQCYRLYQPHVVALQERSYLKPLDRGARQWLLRRGAQFLSPVPR